MNLCNQILENGDKIQSLDDLSFGDSNTQKDKKDSVTEGNSKSEIWLSIILQNGFHDKNHTRVETCNNGNYREFQSQLEAQ